MLSKKNKGITLVALVITIVILLILAGISISTLTNTGIFQKAKDGQQKSEDAALKKNEVLDIYEEEIGKVSGAKEYTSAKTIEEAQLDGMLTKKVNSAITDDYGNKITVPAGFKIRKDDTTNNAITVNQGIVIADKDENEFVWVPVGTIYTSTEHTASNTKTINLNRYTFDYDGIPTPQNESVVETYFQELNSFNKENTVAKNISNFKSSVITNGGYYIGRYEARKNVTSGKLTEVKTDTVWNNITQPDAAKQAQNMYNSINFTSDLMNSYAWDTVILFLQSCGTNTKYSRQSSLNIDSIASTGTINDKQCNVYDIASNVREWITETSSYPEHPCVGRGGNYVYSNDYASYRTYDIISYSADRIGFRPILYIND